MKNVSVDATKQSLHVWLRVNNYINVSNIVTMEQDMQFPTDVLENLKTVPYEETKKPVHPIIWHPVDKVKVPGSKVYTSSKRNYKATYTVANGFVISYAISERSDRNEKPKPVLKVTGGKLNEELVRKRCELILRVLSKGQELRLNPVEKEKGTFIPENIVFVPYST